MNKSYYTPQISHLYIGYECEIFVNKNWIKVTIDKELLIELLNHNDLTNIVRNHVLDREDLIELNLEKLNTFHWGIPFIYDYKPGYLSYFMLMDGRTDNDKFQIGKQIRIYGWRLTCEPTERVYDGLIRCKSELKQLLEMLFNVYDYLELKYPEFRPDEDIEEVNKRLNEDDKQIKL